MRVLVVPVCTIGPTILFDPDYINGTQESFLRLGIKKDSRAYDYSQV